MNEQLTRQLIRQLKIINFWISFFGILFIVSMVIIGVLLWQIVGFVQQTNQRIQSVEDSVSSSLDVKAKACSGTDSFSAWVKQQTGVCGDGSS